MVKDALLILLFGLGGGTAGGILFNVIMFMGRKSSSHTGYKIVSIIVFAFTGLIYAGIHSLSTAYISYTDAFISEYSGDIEKALKSQGITPQQLKSLDIQDLQVQVEKIIDQFDLPFGADYLKNQIVRMSKAGNVTLEQIQTVDGLLYYTRDNLHLYRRLVWIKRYILFVPALYAVILILVLVQDKKDEDEKKKAKEQNMISL